MTGSYFEDVPLEHVEETPGLTITSAHVAIYLGLTRELAADGGAVPDVLPLCFTTGLGWRVPKPPLVGVAFMGPDWQGRGPGRAAGTLTSPARGAAQPAVRRRRGVRPGAGGGG